MGSSFQKKHGLLTQISQISWGVHGSSRQPGPNLLGKHVSLVPWSKCAQICFENMPSSLGKHFSLVPWGKWAQVPYENMPNSSG
jgi:hypothetical protein